jgi:hypothetical protein
MFQLSVRSLNIETKKSPNLFHPIYPIPASLWVLTTYGKLSEQKIMSPVKYLVSQLPKSNDILKHKNIGTLFLLFWYTINFMIFFGAAEMNIVKQMWSLRHILLDFQPSSATVPRHLSDRKQNLFRHGTTY